MDARYQTQETERQLVLVVAQIEAVNVVDQQEDVWVVSPQGRFFHQSDLIHT